MPRPPLPEGPGRSLTTYIPKLDDMLFEEICKKHQLPPGKVLQRLVKGLVSGAIPEAIIEQEHDYEQPSSD